ncbi:MAG: hypothetical protein HZRFUVUK_000659 [Candidatus Fervidibacterota bacterium]|jgi:hypothetical protein
MVYAGFAKVDITPPVNVWLSGYAARTSPAVGIHDELYARALVLSDGERKAAVVSLDLIGLDFELVDATRALVSDWVGINGEALLLNCSHTHSGPSVTALRAMGDVNKAYVQLLPMKIATAVKLASERMRGAKVLLGVCEGAVGINRRERKPNGSIQLGKNPQGVIDPNVYVLRFDGEDGRTLGIVMHHAAHSVVLGPSNLHVSADYPGVAVRAVESVLGGNAMAMFLQGCCGNINALRERQTFDECEMVGIAFAGTALRAFAFAQEIEPLPLMSMRRILQLPLAPPPVEEIERTLEVYSKELDEARRTGNKVKERIATAMLSWAEKAKESLASGCEQSTQPFDVTILRMGDVAIVGLSGEVFIEYALNIRKASPFKETFVLGYTNGCIGYVPTESAFPEGGYEVDTAYKYYGTFMLSPKCEQLILSEVNAMLNELAQ